MYKDFFLFGAGLLVGGMNAIAGGGMLLGFPALLAYGLSAITANATGVVVVLPGQLTSAFGYRDYLRRVPIKYAWLLVPCAIGAAIGSSILKHTTGNDFQRIIPGLLLCAVLLFAYQPLLHAYLHKHMKNRSKRIKPLVVIGIALLPVATYGGFFGAGLGFIMLAFLGFTEIHDAHQMNAMKNVGAAVMCGVSIAVLASGTLINWHAGLVMAAGSAIGGYSGARIARRIPSHAIRVFIIVLGIVTVTYLAFRSY
jgi:uncharacterized protein